MRIINNKRCKSLILSQFDCCKLLSKILLLSKNNNNSQIELDNIKTMVKDISNKCVFFNDFLINNNILDNVTIEKNQYLYILKNVIYKYFDYYNIKIRKFLDNHGYSDIDDFLYKMNHTDI